MDHLILELNGLDAMKLDSVCPAKVRAQWN